MGQDAVGGKFGARRLVVLVTSALVALSSGTNYVVSAYAPQLGSRLRLTHTQLNVFSIAGNVGVYTSGPISGRIMDTKGSRPLLIIASIALLCGYLGIRSLFDRGLDDGEHLSRAHLALLVFCSYLTGVGSNSGMTSATNSTAKTFSDSARAVVVGIVMSGFGFSAFFFSTLSHILFPGNTSDFLLVLALGTALPMVLGFFFVRPLPLPPSISVTSTERGAGASYRRVSFDAAPAALRASSQTRLLSSPVPSSVHDEDDEPTMDAVYTEFSHPPPSRGSSVVRPLAESVQLSLAAETLPHRSRSRARHEVYFEKAPEGRGVDVHGFALTRSVDFWIACSLNVLFSGTGIMYINNVGSIAQALFSQGNPAYDPVAAATWQAAQVSAISLMNFAGRILVGIAADVAKSRFHAPRSYCMTLVACLFVLSQLILITTKDVTRLWIASACLGLAYGGLFGLLPTLCIEWFGLAHFSENWGYVSLFPVIGGNLFSLMFGRNLDAHSSTASLASPVSPSDSVPTSLPAFAALASRLGTRGGLPAGDGPQCFDGRACYVQCLYVTLAACVLATALSVLAGRRDWAHRRSRAGLREEVLWEDEEEGGESD
ncbi:major facilitator superfamily domain-containing protein [Vararia minispora EC-137]|uniref:Major facilitator superfamily domain-containing protein n=1 Tax=Vararia minispora EC-137 TaxID=1314806 RepID=A0ACB8QFE2_9AGAM|nr:major facilitator superfamily domain-containing protein [Vararia minispora EC-137]